jgi:hypothetical protein
MTLRTCVFVLLLTAGCSSGSRSSSSGATAAGTTAAGTTSTPTGTTTAGGGLFGGATGPTTITGGGGATPTQPTGPAPLHAPGQWFKGDMHAHSAPYSDDARRQGGDEPGMCFSLAEYAGLDFLALTDHRTFDQVNDPSYGNQGNLTVLDGTEWGRTVHIGLQGITAQVPEIDNALGPSTYNAQVQAAFDEAHRQGGVVTTNHPCDGGKVNIWLPTDFDCVEVWNIYWSFPEFMDGSNSDVDDTLARKGQTALGIDATPEIRAALNHRGGGINHQAMKYYEEHLNAGRKKAAVGGGDRHSIGLPGLPTTYVYAEDKSRAKILAGIKQARTWVGSADGPRVTFEADADGDGVFERIIGDSVPLNQPVAYRVRVENALDGRVDVIQNGSTIYQFAVLSNDETFNWTDTAQSRSWMRLNVLEHVDFNIPRGTGFQLLAMGSSLFGGGGMSSLWTLSTPYGFQVSLGANYPTIKLPHEIDKILNFDRINWGYAMGAITSPIWAE